jgi:hypothetical protein
MMQAVRWNLEGSYQTTVHDIEADARENGIVRQIKGYY